MKSAGWALAIVLISPVAAKELVVKSALPVYEVILPAGYQATIPPETPVRYVRSSGPEPWAKISLLLSPASDALKQDPTGVKVEQILPFLTLPPDCKYTFSALPWHDLNIGVIEYHTVLKDLPIISRTALLPLQGKALIATVYAPEPLEKEMREDFSLVIYRLTKTVTNWRTAEELGKIETFEKVGMVAVIVSALYPLVWLLLFRGHPMRFHWLRTGWLVTNAILLFIPFSSPGETTMLINPLVNGIMPLALLSFAARRIKMGLES